MSKRLRCKDCENSDKYSYEYPCSTCYSYENFKEKKCVSNIRRVRSMSNVDKIRSMSDSELAEFLSNQFCHGYGKPQIEEWLKSPTTD